MNPSPRVEALLTAPADRWIALSEDESRVVAVGTTFEEVAKAAEENGVSDPIILMVPPDWADRIL